MAAGKLVRRTYTTLVAVLCTAAVAYAIHAKSEAAQAERAGARALTWERYARATRAHRLRTEAGLRVLVRHYNALVRSATTEQRRLLASLATARRHAAAATPSAAPPVVYQTTQLTAISQPAAAPQPTGAAPAAPSTPTTRTS